MIFYLSNRIITLTNFIPNGSHDLFATKLPPPIWSSVKRKSCVMCWMHSSRGFGLLLAGVILTEGRNVLDWESQSIRPQWSTVTQQLLDWGERMVTAYSYNHIYKGWILIIYSRLCFESYCLKLISAYLCCLGGITIVLIDLLY